MRLYHLLVLFLILLLAGCDAPQVTQGLIDVDVSVEGQTADIQLPAGSTVQNVLEAAGLTLGSLDRTEPPLYTVLTDGAQVRIIRVTEEFTVEEIVIPFDNQVVRNESLPEGETRLIQPGVNGLQEITYRRVYEDGVEVSVSPVKTVMLQDPSAEIVMLGSQTPFAPVTIPGRLVYLSAGNAWMMEGTTSARRPIITTGDLDGQILKLSSNGDWLLFTRRAEAEDVINTLWAAKIDGDLLIDLRVENVIHFADWAPTSVLRVAFSTVEPRTTAPGWQANNDLQFVSFSTSGWLSRRTVALETNSGGIYGWWGMSFVPAPDGLRVGYARPDGIGILDLREDEEIVNTAVLDITPVQTQGDWAWVPGLTWSPGGDVMYTVIHAAAEGAASPEASPVFDLAAVPLVGGAPVSIVPQVGMFAQPNVSPLQQLPSGEQAYQIAYLQAIFPTQSDTSRYRLMVMDRDGSDQQVLFPAEGAPGLDPQLVLWSPQTFQSGGNYWLAFLYQGNLWLIDAVTGEAHQLTGDGLIDRLDWR